MHQRIVSFQYDSYFFQVVLIQLYQREKPTPQIEGVFPPKNTSKGLFQFCVLDAQPVEIQFYTPENAWRIIPADGSVVNTWMSQPGS